jgi:hypothetical protein
MGRLLKRVPLDFNHPLNETWTGYVLDIEALKLNTEATQLLPDIVGYSENICGSCEEIFNNCSSSEIHCLWSEEGLRKLWYHEPPEGDGYQLWENTSEGSPQSPVFTTLDELCEWCEAYATVFADETATKEQWKQMLDANFVYHREGNNIFI